MVATVSWSGSMGWFELELPRQAVRETSIKVKSMSKRDFVFIVHFQRIFGSF